MKAVVLAAGGGERLWPLTENRPKPMLPVANRPLLEHLVGVLVEAGVDEVVLVVGANRERIQNYFGDGTAWGAPVSFVVQEPQLGTAHAVRQVEDVVGEDFLVVNGDRLIDAELVERVWEVRRETGDVVMGVTRSETPSEYGVIELEEDLVTGMQEAPPAALARSELINAGVYGFGPDIFAAIRQTEFQGEHGLTETLAGMLERQRIRGVRYQGVWLDVSTPWDLVAVNDALIESTGVESSTEVDVDASAVVSDGAVLGEGVFVHPHATVLRGTTVGDNVSIGPHVVLENSVILSDVTINPGVVMRDCIVGANTTIGANTTVASGPADVPLNDSIHRDVTFGGLIGDNVEVGADVTVRPGAIVGNNTTIESGTTIEGRIPDDSHILGA